MVTASDIERTVATELREVQDYIDQKTEQRQVLREQRKALTSRINTLDGCIDKAKRRRWVLLNEPPTGEWNSTHDTEWVLTDDLAVIIREWLDARLDRTSAELGREAKLNVRRIRMIIGPKHGRPTFTTWRVFEKIVLAMGRHDLFEEGSIKVWSLHSKRLYDRVLREQRNGRRKHN